MQLLNKNYINNPSETKLQHIVKVITDFKINVIVGIIKDQKINNYHLGIENYNVKDAEENPKLRVDIKYLYKKRANKELDNKRSNEIM